MTKLNQLIELSLHFCLTWKNNRMCVDSPADGYMWSGSTALYSEMPKRLIQTDLHELEKESRSKKI